MRSARRRNWASLAGVEWVVGNSHKTQIAELVTVAPYHGNIFVGDIFAQHDFLAAPVEDAAGDRTRPNLKIQDGCNNRCSFCIIPFVRGRSRSAPAERVVEQVRWPRGAVSRDRAQRHQPGALGQGTGEHDAPGPIWSGLLLGETEVERLRLSSVETDGFFRRPAGLDGRVFAHCQARACAVADRLGTGFCAACTAKYRPRHYADRILKARALDAGCGHRRGRHDWLSGRNRGRFRRKGRRSSRTCRSHICTCSHIRSGPGTPARKIRMRLPMAVRKERNRALAGAGDGEEISRFAKAWWARRFPP